MKEKKRKRGYTALDILGFVFVPMGLVYLLVGILVGRLVSLRQGNQLFILVFGGVGGCFLLLGIIFLLVAYSKRNRLRQLMEGGYSVQARITGCHEVKNMTVHGRHPFQVECAWEDPATHAVHIFLSRPLPFDPRDLLTSETVPVYVDRWQVQDGYVDIDACLPEIQMHS
ncbi:MAG: hypothetical protein IJ246_12885 [Clostridia bacterium]|nr:hypothetical protein [Clostridia bacterium]